MAVVVSSFNSKAFLIRLLYSGVIPLRLSKPHWSLSQIGLRGFRPCALVSWIWGYRPSSGSGSNVKAM
jgi:hypothetical protein